jgi:uncharacterized membrane protein YdfJ with MMPL/SSD domain
MTGPLYAIGRFCARHHYPVIVIWLAATVALVLISSAAGRDAEAAAAGPKPGGPGQSERSG